MTTKSIASATAGQKKQIVRLVEEVGESALTELGLNKEDAQRLLGKGGDLKNRLRKLLAPLVQELSVAPNIVVVPDLSAVELTALTKRELNLTYVSGDYAEWDYYRDIYGQPIPGRGMEFEVLVWKPELGLNVTIATVDARAYLRERGYTGHVGAFTQWRRQNPSLTGSHASILEDTACYRSGFAGLCAPWFVFDGDDRELTRAWTDTATFSGRLSLVGFRAVS